MLGCSSSSGWSPTESAGSAAFSSRPCPSSSGLFLLATATLGVTCWHGCWQVYYEGKKAIDYKFDFFFFDMALVRTLSLAEYTSNAICDNVSAPAFAVFLTPLHQKARRHHHALTQS